MIQPKKCLITGGGGFLGSNLAHAYLTLGVEVVVIDALFRTGSKANLDWLRASSANDQLHFFKFDIADYEAVLGVFKEHGPFDYICHLAGQVAMTTSLANPRFDFLTNALGTFNVLEAVRSSSEQSLVAYSSTNKVYGDMRSLNYSESATRYIADDFQQGFGEEYPLDFASPYGCSKGSADQYVRDWHRNFGLQTVVFRHSSIYGGRQFSTFDQGWIGWFCQQAQQQASTKLERSVPNPFTIAGNGKQVRDVLHAEDLIALYQAAYRHRDAAAGQIFNIGGGMRNSLSLLELFHLLEELTAQDDLLFDKLPPRKSDQKVFIANIEKSHHLLGWSPQISARDGIRRMLEWTAQAQNQ